jgi:hypothetical protein
MKPVFSGGVGKMAGICLYSVCFLVMELQAKVDMPSGVPTYEINLQFD